MTKRKHFWAHWSDREQDELASEIISCAGTLEFYFNRSEASEATKERKVGAAVNKLGQAFQALEQKDHMALKRAERIKGLEAELAQARAMLADWEEGEEEREKATPWPGLPAEQFGGPRGAKE